MMPRSHEHAESTMRPSIMRQAPLTAVREQGHNKKSNHSFNTAVHALMEGRLRQGSPLSQACISLFTFSVSIRCEPGCEAWPIGLANGREFDVLRERRTHLGSSQPTCHVPGIKLCECARGKTAVPGAKAEAKPAHDERRPNQATSTMYAGPYTLHACSYACTHQYINASMHAPMHEGALSFRCMNGIMHMHHWPHR